VLYAIRIDNDHDAKEDVTFEFRFTTEQNLPGVPVGFAGAGSGIASGRRPPRARARARGARGVAAARPATLERLARARARVAEISSAR